MHGNGATSSYERFAEEVHRLAGERRAVVLAHNYELPWIQDVADHVGDSLALSRIAARSDAEVIVFCGVHFMAETAKILSPDKTVLLPVLEAGCSLAETVTAEDVRAYRAEHPGAFVVSYVNTSAAVKAESDLCCTSANAVEVVASLPEDAEILFLPDFFLGEHVARESGRHLDLWMGECHVHAAIEPRSLVEKVKANPKATLFIHPECGCTSTALHLLDRGELPAERTRVLSTGAMVEAARELGGGSALVATETGILHQLERANPEGHFTAVNPGAVCRYMKMTTPERLLQALTDLVHPIEVEEGIRRRAERAVQAMIAIGSPSAAGE
ncbi:MAG TPA: quinolinate synthase NadA [Acidimicrobiales bacterium]|nr:quinolinate synthase NadA [Acidimicrobiales bacterium]